MSSTDAEQVFDTPEAAVAHVRRGRRCFFVTVLGPRGWSAYDYPYPTRDDVTTSVRLIMRTTAPARIVVFGRDGERVHVPVPRAQKGGAS